VILPVWCRGCGAWITRTVAIVDDPYYTAVRWAPEQPPEDCYVIHRCTDHPADAVGILTEPRPDPLLPYDPGYRQHLLPDFR
jgi:hypothetical protein